MTLKIGLLGGTGAEGAPAKGNGLDVNVPGIVRVQLNNENGNGNNQAVNNVTHNLTERLGQNSQTNPNNRGDGNAVHNGGDNREGNDFRPQNNNGNNNNNNNYRTNNTNNNGNNNYGANNNNNGNNNGSNNYGANNYGNNNGNNGNHNGWGNGNNGNHNGWGNGNNGNHNGWNHNGHGTQGPQHGQQGPQTNGNGNTETTNPPLIPATQTQNGNGKGTVTPPLQTNGNGKQNPLPPTNGNGQGQGTQGPPIIANPGNQNQTPGPHFPEWNPPIIPTTRNYPNMPNNPVQTTVIQILRQNDIFISQSRLNDLINGANTNANNRSTNVPNEVRNLVQSVIRELSNLTNPQNIRQTTTVISNNLQSQINSAREILIYTTQPDVRNFGNLNIQERVFLAVEMMFNHLPSNTGLDQLSTREIYNGLLLARGMVLSGENTGELRNLIALRGDVLPNGFSATGLRDLGQLVKVLVAGAVNANTTANLDAAVQKFIKILVAKNELGVLLAASMLGKQAELGSISMNRTLALVQVYQLITRLMLAGEAALKEAAVNNGLSKNDNNPASAGLNKITNAEEKTALLRDLQNNNLHNNLRNFLEFNPALVTDRAASSFNNTEDARNAQQHFANTSQDEIEQWLKSGNHRFVKEIDLDKPVGIVVERGTDEFISATKARIVLVRDSSAQGWHFLKSFLVT